MLVVGVGIGLVMQVLVLVVQNDARPQTSASRPRPRRSSARSAARSASRSSARSSRRGSPASWRSSRRRGGPSRQRRPPQPRAGEAPAPEVHDDFLHAFSHSLHGVFLWGMAFSVIPFALSWLLKEVPLRTTLGPPRSSSQRRRRRRDARRTGAGDGCKAVARSRLEAERVERLRAGGDDHALRLEVVVDLSSPSSRPKPTACSRRTGCPGRREPQVDPDGRRP